MSDTQTGPDATQSADPTVTEATTLETYPDAAEGDAEADTFPRKVVSDLRREAAGHRDRANTAEARIEELSRALFTARVAATGLLADATDLAFDAESLDDTDKLIAAITALTEAKPHLKAQGRKPFGNVGQGERGYGSAEFSLVDRLKGNA